MSKQAVRTAFTVLLAVILLGAWWQQDAIYDIWRLRGYTPSAEIVTLADKTSMTDSSRRLFYVYRPQLEDKSAFNAHCTGTEQTIVLGCYIERQGIYLYKVSDPRLNGVIEVTAAHELLHAVYDRLSTSERERIDGLTADVAAKITDERLKKTLENYRKKDPSIVSNELHSILATEVRELPSELEQYYAQYFAKRGSIIVFAEAYNEAFTARENEVEAIDAQLTRLKTQIDSLNGALVSQQSLLKNQFAELNQLRQSGSTAEYNQQVPVYNQAVNNYNASVNQQKLLVAEYNSLVEKRNTLAVEENQLIEALDSRQTIETQ